MSDARLKSLPPKKKGETRVVRHEKVITAEPELLSPEEEAFNRFLEEEAASMEKAAEKPGAKTKR